MPKFKTKIKNIFGKKKLILVLPLSVILLVSLLFLAYNLFFWGKIFPGVYLAGVYVGGETPSRALEAIGARVEIPQKLTLTAGEKKFEISLKDINANYDIVESAKAAFGVARTGNILYDLWERVRTPFVKKNLGLRVTLDEQKLGNLLSDISGQVAVEPVFPSLALIKGTPVVNKGKAGSEMDTGEVRLKIGKALSLLNVGDIEISLAAVDPTLSDAQAAALTERAEKLNGKSIILKFEFQTFTYKGEPLLGLLDARSLYNEKALSELVSSVSNQINRASNEPVFVFEEGRVNEFEPAKDGVAVQESELKDALAGGLKTLETEDESVVSLDIPVAKTAPKIKTGDVNNLGIKELVGRGTSRFRGSIANRIHNISLAASKFRGVLVAPGETFSFNQVLGDVSELTGFKQAYIIKEGKTVLGDGGGVCQVSTTLFRALLNAGLPILERQAHAYRVGYYEQDSPPGLDATVFAPSPDLKFKNDTPGHILIQSSVDTKTSTLVFEIYGTKDGRVATTSKPVITAQVAPPEDLYIDDPTLPAGTVKQTEHKAWGARVVFNYSVTRGGEEVYKKTFVSTYRPWQAVYLRGTGPIQ